MTDDEAKGDAPEKVNMMYGIMSILLLQSVAPAALSLSDHWVRTC
jgi:hypothetical protein